MALAEVQSIIQAIENTRNANIQREQLAQQHEEFIKNLEQQHEQMVNAHDLAQITSKANIAKLASTDPNFMQSFAGAKQTGTTGDPGYQSPMIGGSELALNPSRDPNQYNTFDLPGVGSINSPTMPTFIAQQAAQKLALAKAELGPKEDFSAFEHGQDIDTETHRAKDAQTLAGLNNTAEMQRQTQRSIDEALQKTADRALESRRINNEDTYRKLSIGIQQQQADTEKKRYEDQYGTGSFGPALDNAKKDVILGNSTLDEATKDLSPAAKKTIASSLLSEGKQSIDKNQKAILSQIGNLSQVLGKMDAFNGMSVYDPTTIADRSRLSGEIRSQLGSIAQVLNSEPGRKAEWMIKAAEKGAVPENSILGISVDKQNKKKREDFAGQVKQYLNSFFSNIKPDQRQAIFDNYGIDKMFAPAGSGAEDSDAAKEFKKKHGLQ